ncbi:MAG: hypothetical protein ACC707_20305, partial [Thiohalomonadales bacterium]
MSKVSLNILTNQYSSGKISREEFLYFHALLSDSGMSHQPVQTVSNFDPNDVVEITLESTPPTPVVTAAPAPQPAQPDIVHTNNVHAEFTDAEDSQAATDDTPDGFRPAFLQTISHFLSQHYKQTVALVTVVGVVSTFVSDYFTSKPENTPRSSIVRSIDSENRSESVRTQNTQKDDASTSPIESLAWVLVEKRPWGRKDIKKFDRAWRKLSSREKRQAKKSSWYKQFSLALTTNLAQQSALANDGNISAVYVERALSNLTDSLRSAKPIEQNKKIAARQNSVSERKQASKVVASTSRKRSDRQKPIRQSEIDSLIDKYINYYENGNIRSIAKLFKRNRRKSN